MVPGIRRVWHGIGKRRRAGKRSAQSQRERERRGRLLVCEPLEDRRLLAVLLGHEDPRGISDGPSTLIQPAAASANNLPPRIDGLVDRAAHGETLRVIVELASREDQSAVAQQARDQGATVIRQYDRFPLLALQVNENALQGLLNSPRVVSLMEDVPQPPALDNSLTVIGADQAHSLGYDGSGATVAILDTGIDRDHPFFSGRVVEEATDAGSHAR